MTLQDLPEKIQLQIIEWSDTHMRENNLSPTELLKHLDEAMVAGMNLEANRHNSSAEHLWQSLCALKNLCQTQFIQTPQLVSTLSLVDQCLIENKPDVWVRESDPNMITDCPPKTIIP